MNMAIHDDLGNRMKSFIEKGDDYYGKKSQY